ncbi:MAG: dihydroxyacetone kinase subunit L [Planctomycetes bacterium]|nr:dihydroxyacetone kinase subunit L [Planctomycetota bacterium]
MLTLTMAKEWINALAKIYDENQIMLTELDAAIGDADHGINMARGFNAAKTDLDTHPQSDLPGLFRTVAMALIKNVGGASGPLYGSFFMKGGPSLPADNADLAAVLKAFEAGVGGIQKMGKAEAGEKTMLDAWLPALKEMAAAVGDGAGFADGLARTAATAEAGAEATVEMLATKGRASYLGQRSVGHKDPGAASTALMIRSLADLAKE